MHAALTQVVQLLIRAYQQILSPLLGRRCRFHPSCSQYALDAIRLHGLVRGVWLAMRRLIRCQPFNPGGYDPVPEKLNTTNYEPEPTHRGCRH